MSTMLRRALFNSKIYRTNTTLRPIVCRKLSSQTAEEQSEVEKNQKREIDLKTFRLAPRTVSKQPALPPCIKQMFVGEIHEAYFPYLEVVEKEHVDKFLKDRKFTIQQFWENTGNKEKCMDGLKLLGSTGYDVPQVYNGRGYGTTEITLNTEVEVDNYKASSILNSHRAVTQIITEFGTEAQQNLYLPRLANGELIGTVAVFEREPSQEDPFHTIANPTNDGFILDGEKYFVLNGTNANLFLVLASSINQEHTKKQTRGVTAFLVDGNDPGVLRGPLIKTIGCNEAEICNVTFTGVPIREHNILGEINRADKIGMKLLQISRIQNAVAANQLMKRVLNHFTRYCIETKIMGVYPMDWELLQVKLGRMVSEVFAIESMIYFTTQLIDGYENQNVEVEAAALKLYAMESLMNIVTLPFQTIGPKTTIDDEITSQNIRDAIQIFGQSDTVDTLRLFIGFLGIEHAGREFAELVEKGRNPLFYPQGMLKTMFTGNPFDAIKITKQFIDYLHPSLIHAAEMLEISLKRFKIASECSLQRHGQEIFKAQSEANRLAQCAKLMYATLAVISRASRSLSIGVRYADMEILLANTFALETMNEMIKLTEQIQIGQNQTNDMNHIAISRQLFESKGYFYQHPLTREF